MTALLEPIFRKPYMLSGRAKVTLVSRKTQDRYTYQLQKAEHGSYYVRVLVGPNNQRDYRYVGLILPDRGFTPTQASPKDAPSYKAFAWAWTHLDDTQRLEVWHSGSCGRCGRELTDPKSIQRGLGPKCAGEV